MSPAQQAAQQANADRIRQITQNRREDAKASPEEKLLRMVIAEVSKQVAAAFAQVNLAGANGITISGKFPNLTIGLTNANTGKITGATAVCNDDQTITISITTGG